MLPLLFSDTSFTLNILRQQDDWIFVFPEHQICDLKTTYTQRSPTNTILLDTIATLDGETRDAEGAGETGDVPTPSSQHVQTNR